MKTAIVVDGEAEYKSLPLILKRCSHQGLRTVLVLKCPGHPKSNPQRIAHAIARKANPVVRVKRLDRIIALIDLEDLSQRASERARQLEEALRGELNVESIDVVVKDKKYENWLIADVDALRQLPSRFTRIDTIARELRKPNVDLITDASDLLHRAVEPNKAYRKIDDAKMICSTADPLRAARHSRSLRRLLRVLGVPQYTNQSCRPHG